MYHGNNDRLSVPVTFYVCSDKSTSEYAAVTDLLPQPQA